MSQEKDFISTVSGLASFMSAEEAHGFQIVEWSTTRFTRLYPYLSQVVDTLLKGGATLENIQSYLTSNIPKLVDAVVPHMDRIILLSCPGKTEEDIEKLPWTHGLEIVILIFKKNMEHVADFFVQKSAALKAMIPADTNPNS